MGIRNTGAFALHLLLVLASLVATAGHDHLGERDHEARLCVIDHHAEHERRLPSSLPRLGTGAKQHEHECPGCRLSSQRMSLDAPRSTGQSLLVAQASRGQDALEPPLLPRSNRTTRGPPAS